MDCKEEFLKAEFSGGVDMFDKYIAAASLDKHRLLCGNSDYHTKLLGSGIICKKYRKNHRQRGGHVRIGPYFNIIGNILNNIMYDEQIINSKIIQIYLKNISQMNEASRNYINHKNISRYFSDYNMSQWGINLLYIQIHTGNVIQLNDEQKNMILTIYITGCYMFLDNAEFNLNIPEPFTMLKLMYLTHFFGINEPLSTVLKSFPLNISNDKFYTVIDMLTQTHNVKPKTHRCY